ncbi:MAG: rhomboid family intramembrane serine protease [Phycisphaerae bacterium]
MFHSAERSTCLDRALVLQSVGIEYRIVKARGEYTLVVAAGDSDRAVAELDAYANESRGSSVDTRPLPDQAGGWEGVLVFAAVVLLIAVLQDHEIYSFDWFARGKMNAGLVRQGEWWRAVTALSLHVHLGHLIGNLVIGGLFGLFAGRLLGSGLAWAGILLAGALGNAMNAWVQPDDHNAVGASTAIFGALGILSACAWIRRRGTEDGWVRRWTPILGGVVLLSLTGAGGENTDVIAHLTGFASGLALGALFGVLEGRIDFKANTQFAFGLAALASLALCWLLALRS